MSETMQEAGWAIAQRFLCGGTVVRETAILDALASPAAAAHAIVSLMHNTDQERHLDEFLAALEAAENGKRIESYRPQADALLTSLAATCAMAKAAHTSHMRADANQHRRDMRRLKEVVGTAEAAIRDDLRATGRRLMRVAS